MAIYKFLTVIFILTISYSLSNGCGVFNRNIVPGLRYQITSPNFPFPYPGYAYSCSYSFIAPPNYRIQVVCPSINIRPSYRCQYAALQYWPSGDFSQSYLYFCNWFSQGIIMNTNGRFFAARFINRAPNYAFRTGFTCMLSAFPVNIHVPPPALPSVVYNNTNNVVYNGAPLNSTEINDTNNKCTCGLENRHHRIVGGTTTRPNQYPWMVALVKKYGQVFCGATIISDEWILTAAHCLQPFTPGNIRLIFGAHDILNINAQTAVEKRAIQFIIHEGYNGTSVDNDIGLVRLSSKLKFKREISPVCLPYKFLPDSFKGKTGKTMGWGTEKHVGGSVQDELQQVEIDLFTSKQCADTFTEVSSRITNNMFCGYRAGKDACQGDSGGPLIYKDVSGLNYIIGIVSWGVDCAKPNHPGVYTQVNNYLRWIEEKTGSTFCKT